MPDKPATVVAVTSTRTTATEGETIDFIVSVEGHGLEFVHQGDLVIELDSETVYKEEGFYIGNQTVDVRVPIKFNSEGGHDICGTLMNITGTQIPT